MEVASNRLLFRQKNGDQFLYLYSWWFVIFQDISTAQNVCVFVDTQGRTHPSSYSIENTVVKNKRENSKNISLAISDEQEKKIDNVLFSFQFSLGSVCAVTMVSNEWNDFLSFSTLYQKKSNFFWKKCYHFYWYSMNDRNWLFISMGYVVLSISKNKIKMKIIYFSSKVENFIFLFTI